MQFCYISPISRLKSLYSNRTLCRVLDELRKPRRAWKEGDYHDMHSGEHYRSLCTRMVSWDGQTQQPERQYFQDDTDIPMGLSSDGVSLYKRSRLDVRPLMITNYALPPEMRTQREHRICVGLIPGEIRSHSDEVAVELYSFLAEIGTADEGVKKVVNIDSYLQPLMSDLKILAIEGVPAFRWIDGELQPFRLRGHLVLVCGDMPAVAKVWRNRGNHVICVHADRSLMTDDALQVDRCHGSL